MFYVNWMVKNFAFLSMEALTEMAKGCGRNVKSGIGEQPTLGKAQKANSLCISSFINFMMGKQLRNQSSHIWL
jgi:hypothetical protein